MCFEDTSRDDRKRCVARDQGYYFLDPRFDFVGNHAKGVLIDVFDFGRSKGVGFFVQQHCRAKRRTVRDGFVGRKRIIWRLSGERLQHLFDHRHSRRTTNEDDFVDVSPFQFCGFERLPHGKIGSVKQIKRQVFKQFPRDF